MLIVIAIFAALTALELQLDASHDNRIINPMLGVVLTLLGSSIVVQDRGPETRPLHIVHMILYFICLLYVRAMIDIILRYFFFESQ